jgi:integrase
MISILLGCGLRRAELASLRKEDVQLRQGHWAIVDLVGKGGHIRTVPMPVWVKGAVDRWMRAAAVTEGHVFRAVSRHGTSWGKGISENVVWYVVRNCARRMEFDHLAPHDLRRTCANVWSAALSQAKSELTGWSAQMYSTFGGVYDSWPGWNAPRPRPI